MRRVAVTGIGVVSPLGNDTGALFAALSAGRSGIASVSSSSTCTNPAGSPFGETSIRPFASLDAMRTKGDAAISARQCTSSRVISFFTERVIGGPITSRSSASDARTSESSIIPA